MNSSEVAIRVGVAFTAVPAWLMLFLALGLGGAYGFTFARKRETADALTALSYLLVAITSAWALLFGSGAAVSQAYLLTIVHLLINGAIRAIPELVDKCGVSTSILHAGTERAPGTGRPFSAGSEVL